VASRLLVLVLAAALGLAAVPAASADLADEEALAEKFAPVVRLVEQQEECGPGEPYVPTDVALLFDDEPTVALRGPWNASDLVRIGPADTDVADLYEYHLDFPGDALDPGCTYELWARRLTEGSEPAVFAHVASDPAYPGKLALQYWFFYPFNDFNNTHEGDWEMIQLVFDADDARAALDVDPALVGYSSHEGAERSDWDDEEKLARVDGTHPVVYPAAGSHANKFTEALYLGSSAEAGVGCDDTRGPHREIRPAVKTIPSDPSAARDAFPWITFEGRWGELQKAFYNGPTGPNLKTQWTEPIEWSQDWRDRSYAVPTAGILGTNATDFFCTGVAAGSRALTTLLRNPLPMLLLLGVLLALVAFVVIRVTWTPTAPLRLGRRRSFGQILSASARMYAERPLVFLGIGLLLLPIGVLVAVLQWLVVTGIDLVVAVTGEAAGFAAFVALVIGATLTLFGLAFVMAATTAALVEIDAGRPIDAPGAFRLAGRRLRPLLGGAGIFVLMWVALTATGILIPIAIWIAIRWSLLAPVLQLEDMSGRAGLRRSARLVRRRWLRVGALVGLSAGLALAIGPLLGVLLIFATSAPLALLNVVAGLVYALALPFVALVAAYVYFDARARHELEREDVPDELPAEIALGAS
jgi:hypothetical protein